MKSTAARVSLAGIVILALFALSGCQLETPPLPPTPAPPAQTPTPSPTPPPTVPAPDYWPTAGWKSSSPEEQGMDSDRLATMFDAVEQRDLNLHSLLIIRNGYLVTEAYFMPYNRTVKHQVASVTKSVTGMLTGIAMAEGGFQSMNERVLPFFPGWTVANLDQNKRNLALVDLLTLTAGLDCSDAAGTLDGMFQSRDWVKFTLDLPMAGAPGRQFRYCSPAVHLLSPILKQATGRNERELANETLFRPLGIPSVTLGEWESDPQAVPAGFTGLRLAPRDMARLGFLYLHDGEWNGKQVVPANWVAASLARHSVEPESGRRYGYLFWIFDRQGYYAALGLGGQDIYIIPARNMVVVFTAALNDATQVQQTVRLLDEYIVPASLSAQPLAEDPAAWARLQNRISRAASPQMPVPALPALARSISGKVYDMAPNPGSWRTISLSFDEGSPVAQATINGTTALPIGLDNIYRITQAPAGALRGHWEGEETFVVESHTVGTVLQWEYRITFPDDRMQIDGRELVKGTKNTVTGRLAR